MSKESGQSSPEYGTLDAQYADLQYFATSTVWCEDGHDPKTVEQDRGVGICPECGAEYSITLEVEQR